MQRFSCALIGICWLSISLGAQTTAATDWTWIQDTTAAITFELPGEPLYQCNEVSEPDAEDARLLTQRVCLYNYVSENRQLSMALSVLNMPYDILPASPEETLSDVVSKLQAGGYRERSRRPTEKARVPGHTAVLAGPSGTQVFLAVYVRGPRIYRLITEFRALEEPAAQRFLRTFRFLPTAAQALPTEALPGINAVLRFPKERVATDTLVPDYPDGYRREYYGMDTLAGINYYVEDHYHGPLFSHRGNEEFYRYWKESRQTLYSGLQDTTWRGEPALLMYFDGIAGNQQLIRLQFWEGNHEITLSAYAFDDSLSHARAWQYFDSYRPQRDYPFDYVRADRSAAILDALSSSDSTTQRTAVAMMGEYVFDSTALPTLYTLLADPPVTRFWGKPDVADRLWGELGYTYDSTTYAYLTARYATADSIDRDRILHALSTRSDHLPSARFVIAELPEHLRRSGNNGLDSYAYNNFLASESQLIQLLPEIKPWLRDTTVSLALLYALADWVYTDSTAIDSLLLPWRPALLEMALALERQYPPYPVAATAPPTPAEIYRQLLGILTALPADDDLREFYTARAAIPHPPYARRIGYGLVNGGLPIPSVLWQTLWTDLAEYYLLCYNLATIDQLKLIPPGDLQLEKLVQGAVIDYMNDELGTAFSLTPLPVQEMELGYEECQVFPFYLRFDHDPAEKYLVVAARTLPAVDYKLDYYVQYGDEAVTEENEDRVMQEVLRKLAGE